MKTDNCGAEKGCNPYEKNIFFIRKLPPSSNRYSEVLISTHKLSKDLQLLSTTISYTSQSSSAPVVVNSLTTRLSPCPIKMKKSTETLQTFNPFSRLLELIINYKTSINYWKTIIRFRNSFSRHYF